MIRYLYIVAVVFVCLLIQLPLLRLLGLGTFSVDATLVATVFLASTGSGAPGLVAAGLMGLMTDAFIPDGLIGMQAEIQAVMFLLARLGTARFQLNRTVPLMLVVFVSGVLSTLMFMLFSVIFDRGYSHSSMVVTRGLAQAGMTAVFAPLLFRLFGIADGRFHRKRDVRSLFV